LRERAPATTLFTIADRLCARVFCDAVCSSQFAKPAFAEHIATERRLEHWVRPIASSEAVTNPLVYRTRPRAFRARRIGRPMVGPCEILVVRKLGPSLCHLTKGQASGLVVAFLRPMSALHRHPPTLVGRCLHGTALCDRGRADAGDCAPTDEARIERWFLGNETVRRCWCKAVEKLPPGGPHRPLSGTLVLGTFCHPCLRAGRRNCWWAVTDSNRRHSACKADALPTELTALRGEIYRRLPQRRKGPAAAALSETAVPD
jgi:hypothetical protein